MDVLGDSRVVKDLHHSNSRRTPRHYFPTCTRIIHIGAATTVLPHALRSDWLAIATPTLIDTKRSRKGFVEVITCETVCVVFELVLKHVSGIHLVPHPGLWLVAGYILEIKISSDIWSWKWKYGNSLFATSVQLELLLSLDPGGTLFDVLIGGSQAIGDDEEVYVAVGQ